MCGSRESSGTSFEVGARGLRKSRVPFSPESSGGGSESAPLAHEEVVAQGVVFS